MVCRCAWTVKELLSWLHAYITCLLPRSRSYRGYNLVLRQSVNNQTHSKLVWRVGKAWDNLEKLKIKHVTTCNVIKFMFWYQWECHKSKHIPYEALKVTKKKLQVDCKSLIFPSQNSQWEMRSVNTGNAYSRAWASHPHRESLGMQTYHNYIIVDLKVNNYFKTTFNTYLGWNERKTLSGAGIKLMPHGQWVVITSLSRQSPWRHGHFETKAIPWNVSLSRRLCVLRASKPLSPTV